MIAEAIKSHKISSGSLCSKERFKNDFRYRLKFGGAGLSNLEQRIKSNVWLGDFAKSPRAILKNAIRCTIENRVWVLALLVRATLASSRRIVSRALKCSRDGARRGSRMFTTCRDEKESKNFKSDRTRSRKVRAMD